MPRQVEHGSEKPRHIYYGFTRIHRFPQVMKVLVLRLYNILMRERVIDSCRLAMLSVNFHHVQAQCFKPILLNLLF